jgi:hypothetical protein
LTDLSRIREALPLFADLLQRRGIYVTRLATFRDIAGDGAPADIADPPRLPSLAAQLAATLPDRAGVQVQVARAIQVTRSKLDKAKREAEAFERTLGDDRHYGAINANAVKTDFDYVMGLLGFPALSPKLVYTQLLALQERQPKRPGVFVWAQDVALEYLEAVLEPCRRLEAELSDQETHAAAAAALVAAKVKAAVEAFGGFDQIVTCVMATDAGPPHSVHAADRKEHAAKAALDNLKDLGIREGPAVEEAKSLWDKAKAEAKTARSITRDDRKLTASKLVEAALIGDESARSELERLSQKFPGALAGFGDELNRAHYDRAGLAQLAAALNPPVEE